MYEYRLQDELVDLYSARIKAAAIVLKSKQHDKMFFNKFNARWRVVGDGAKDPKSKSWFSLVVFENFPSPPHLMIHFAMFGAMAEYLFCKFKKNNGFEVESFFRGSPWDMVI